MHVTDWAHLCLFLLFENIKIKYILNNCWQINEYLVVFECPSLNTKSIP